MSCFSFQNWEIWSVSLIGEVILFKNVTAVWPSTSDLMWLIVTLITTLTGSQPENKNMDDRQILVSQWTDSKVLVLIKYHLPFI